MLGTYSSPLRTSGSCFLARLALRGQHDGAHLERSLLEIGQRDLGDERAHAAGLVFAHHEFELVLARRQIEAGGVLDVLLPRLQRRIEVELDGIAHAAHRALGFVDHGADDVERGLVLVAALHKGNLRAGHDERNRHVEAVGVEAEVHGVHVDGHVGGGQIAGQLILRVPARGLPCRSA